MMKADLNISVFDIWTNSKTDLMIDWIDARTLKRRVPWQFRTV